MEVQLAKLEAKWSVVEFTFEMHKTSGCEIPSLTDEHFETLEEHQMIVQNMFGNRFVATFEAEASKWQQELANVNEVVQIMNEVVRKWRFLENLFLRSEEVKIELPDDSERFTIINSEIIEVLEKCYETKKVKEFCNDLTYLQTLEQAASKLQLCELSLNEFMNTKRRIFPRFFFVATADLLDVLANGNSPAKVVPSFPKFFQAVRDLELTETKSKDDRPTALAFNSTVGVERVALPKQCQLQLHGKVEIYLERCITMFLDTLLHYISKALHDYGADSCKTDSIARAGWVKTKIDIAQTALLVSC